MGKKNKQSIKIAVSEFPFKKLVLYFLLFFSVSLGILLILTPLLSLAKLSLVREAVRLILRNKTPYIHPIPYFRSISLSLAVFTGLFFAYRKVNISSQSSTRKQLFTVLFSVIFLWLLEVGSQVLMITFAKLNITSFLSIYLLNLLLSVGWIGFPILLWLFLFHPTFLD